MNAKTQLVPLLETADLQRSVRFYCDGLGFRITESWEPGGQLAWCRIERKGTALMLQQVCSEGPKDALNGRGIMLYLICADAVAEHRTLTRRGIAASQPETAFYGMVQTFLTDPDGRQLCFESRVTTPSPPE